MDATDIKLYKKALAEGEEKVYNIRVMIVGHFGVGKTVLTKRLLDQHQDVDILSRIPTEGIDVHVGKMKVDLKDENWIQQTSDDGNKFFERKAKVVSQQITEGDKISDFSKKISAAGVKTMSKQQIEYQKTTEEDDEEDFEEDGDESLQESFESGGVKEMETNKQTNVSIENQNEDSSTETDMKICQEISEVRKVTQNEQSAYLSIWDCAGQYAFYDTHQVFMSWRTIYLLVTDLSKEPNEAVEEDNCYVDCMGKFAEFWLNAIHKCSALDEKHKGSFAGKPDFDETDKRSQSPPVILVGTYADKLQILEKKFLLEKMIQQNGPITTADELNLFLKFHHETGNLIFFSEDEDLNKTIVLDSQWLINAFKRLNQQREFFTGEHEIFKKWKDFDKYGILPKPLIETMWKEDSQDKSNIDGNTERNTSEFLEHKDHILDYLEKLQLLAKPHKDTCNISNVNEANLLFD